MFSRFPQTAVFFRLTLPSITDLSIKKNVDNNKGETGILG